jgi:hypothetical protein
VGDWTRKIRGEGELAMVSGRKWTDLFGKQQRGFLKAIKTGTLLKL